MRALAEEANEHSLALYEIVSKLNELNKSCRKDFYRKGNSKTFYAYDYISTKHSDMDILYFDEDRDQFFVNSCRNHEKTIVKFPHYKY